MSKFQIEIVSHERPSTASGKGKSQRFGVRKHTRASAKAIDSIDSLGQIWDQVVEKLSTLASKTHEATQSTKYELQEIEFSIGIEAGLNVGLVTKGDASVSIKFARKPKT